MSNRILLVQMADIGDLVVATPAIAALREARPDAHIALLTSPHAAHVIDPALVDDIITFRADYFSARGLLNPVNWSRIRWLLFKLRQNQYDTIVYLRHLTLRLGTIKHALIAYALGSPRRIGLDNGKGWFLTERLPDGGFGAKHEAQHWLDLVALLDADSAPRHARVRMGEGILPIPAYGRRAGAKGVRVIIHAGSGGYSLARRWDAEKFAQVADRLCDENDAQIILVGTANDDSEQVKAAMLNTPVDLTGKTELSQLADLLRSADLFIGADSGVMHMAAAIGTPVVAVFGPSNHEAWGPWSPDGMVRVVRSAPECSPCSYIEHGIGLREGCPARTCMRMVTAQHVLKAARDLLENRPIVTETRAEVSIARNRLHILDMPVDAVTYKDWMKITKKWIEQGERCHHVCTTNPEFIMIARRDVNFRNILKRADLCVPDGVGLILASRWLRSPLPERVTGSDGVPVIAQHAAKHGWTLFFLGAKPGVAEQAAAVLREKHPLLQVVGTYAGSPSPEEEDAIVAMVNESGADILLVAYGAPQQDKWIARNLPRLTAKMAMGVGGSFDFIAGTIPRAPLWMQRYGLEWLFRLYKQPWRIWRMTRLPRFVLAVLLRGRDPARHHRTAGSDALQ